MALKRLPTHFTGSAKELNNFSIVVAMRNEQHNVAALLNSLTSLNYPKDKLEVILVDDFSEDLTVETLKEKLQDVDLDIKVISLKNEGLTHNRAFKKTAIQFGVAKAKHDWIATTDADCVYKPEYLKLLNAFIEKHKPKFVSAPVELAPANTLFQKMQALEFKGLVALGAAYLQRDKPFLCNGANLAFRREVFMQLNGFKGFDHFESGDDVWFMHKVQERYPFELYFAMHEGLVVRSSPTENLSAFVNQRKRWTAKNSGYKKVSQLVTLAFDYLFYLFVLVNLFGGIFSETLLVLAGFMILSKNLTEINLYAAVNKWIKTPFWPLIYFATVPFQIVYVVAIYPLSQLTKFNWKNRIFNA
jgi:cellulose synthase/poly-beta-1,6-N-acetylglucosamine synthase-like glycosyltransferase